MKVFIIVFLIFSSISFSQENRIDTIRFTQSIDASLASPLKIEITYREDLKRIRIKILKGSYIGNIKWLVPEESLMWAEKDINVFLSREKRKEIIEEAKKIDPKGIMPDWEYEKDFIYFDGDWTKLYFSNWFENRRALELSYRNPDLDTEERGLTQYYKVLKLIEKAVRY